MAWGPPPRRVVWGVRGLDAPVVGRAVFYDIVHGVEVFALAVEDFAEVASADHALHVAQAEGVADLVAHVIFEAVAVGELDDAVTFVQCGGHGDFGEDVLAGFEGHDGVPAVEMIGGGDDDEIDGGVVEHGLGRWGSGFRCRIRVLRVQRGGCRGRKRR